MAKFKNNITGNVIRVKDKAAIALVEKSDNYTAYVADKKGGKQGKKADDKNAAPATPDAGKQPEGSNAE